MTRVFISYSHDSDAHRERVLALSDRLRADGIDCDIDQYNPAPEQGWPRWMMQGIQQADYVLLVCTETYRMYRHETFNTKFIPLVFDAENKAHIPDILFGYDYHDLSQPRGYDNLYRHIRGELGAEKPSLGKPRYTRTIYSNSLPTVEGKLFGRTDELALLDKAWADPQTHVVQFVASGGTGKTKLLKHWLDTNTDSIEALIAWSFYSQGSSEDKQISATPFFSHVFGVLKSDKTRFNTEEEKGEHLAHLLRQRRCLLVLDGLEPLQHAGRGMRGELKDRAIRQLLKSLAGEHNSLCIVTTRIAVHELSDRAHVISHDLQNLAPQDGISLLKSWEVHGSETELEKAVHEYGCHALALHLLGNALHTYLDGDVRRRDTLSELIDDYDDAGRHAFKVMQAYSRWLEGAPDLQLLHLLGLFDHPIETEVLQVLWQAQIPNLTAGIPEKAWKVAIRDLREKHRMLSAHEGRPDLLDCHPLIREYFGKQLQTQHPDAWQQAHARLYDCFTALSEKRYKKFLPETLKEMQPLFGAVAHGCAAGKANAALKLYMNRIKRNEEDYIVHKLGLLSDDLSLLANFFSSPWSQIISNLDSGMHPALFNWVGFSLLAIGRYKEAREVSKASINHAKKSSNQSIRVISTHTLSTILMIEGCLDEAANLADEAIILADTYLDEIHRIGFRAAHGYILFLTGSDKDAADKFIEAESIQKNWQPKTRLYSEQGYHAFEFYLAYASSDVSYKYAQYLKSIACTAFKGKVLEEALATLALAKVTKNKEYCNTSIHLFRQSNQIQYVVLGLLARAALYCTTCDLARARQDLQEVFDIAEPSGMRLHLTDYHLEMARLLVAAPGFDFAQPSNSTSHDDSGTTHCLSEAEGNMEQARCHTAAAERLINATGYHRRDAELAFLTQIARRML